MPLPPETPPPDDDAFATADDSLLAFLRQKLAGEPLPAAAAAHFHESDIYAADPATLTAGYRPVPEKKGEGGSCWFFFTRVRPKSAKDSRKSRLVGGGVGTWQNLSALPGESSTAWEIASAKVSISRTSARSARTGYMVEFSEDHGADHERVLGGEAQLVLCKIYKAHACSSSGSTTGCASRQSSCKKRKADDHRADLASARRLFDPSAPVLSATSSDEATVVYRYNVAARIFGWEETSVEKLRSEGWLDTMRPSSATISDSDSLFGTEPAEASQDKVTRSPCESIDTFWTPEVAALHSQVDTSSGFFMAGNAPPAQAQVLSPASWISGSAFSTQQDPCDPTHSSWMPETQASDSSFLMTAGDAPPAPARGLSSASWISYSAFSAEEDPRDPTHRSWMPETEAPQVDADNFLMAGDVPPAPAHCAPGSSSASWSSNNTTSSCSSELGWFLGAPTGDDELSRAVVRFTNKCSMPCSHVLPQVTAAPSWCSIPDIGTC